jgi:hypothetical protein
MTVMKDECIVTRAFIAKVIGGALSRSYHRAADIYLELSRPYA